MGSTPFGGALVFAAPDNPTGPANPRTTEDKLPNVSAAPINPATGAGITVPVVLTTSANLLQNSDFELPADAKGAVAGWPNVGKNEANSESSTQEEVDGVINGLRYTGFNIQEFWPQDRFKRGTKYQDGLFYDPADRFGSRTSSALRLACGASASTVRG